MKNILITTIAAVLLVGCVTIQSIEPTTVKVPDISIWQAAQTGNTEALKQHLFAGADVNAKDDLSSTPLLYAVGRGHMELVELLIAKGADMNVKANEEWTPLHTTALEGNKEVVELLIAKGVDVNAKDVDGKTPLNSAEGETADLLRKHGGKTGEELKVAGK